MPGGKLSPKVQHMLAKGLFPRPDPSDTRTHIRSAILHHATKAREAAVAANPTGNHPPIDNQDLEALVTRLEALRDGK